MLIPKDKSSLMNLILEQQPQGPTDTNADGKPAVLIIDAMCEVQALKKSPTTTKMLHLKESFIKRVKPKLDRYPESRLFFDTYNEIAEFSLKDGAREQRAESVSNELPNQYSNDGYQIHDEMSLKKTPLSELFTNTKTKKRLTMYLAKAVLEEYDGNKDHKVIVIFGTTININKPHQLDPGFKSHRHEEADTQILLHVLQCISVSAYKHIDVYSLDTDVLILLMDLVSRGHLEALTSLTLYAGFGKAKGKSKIRETKVIDIIERVRCFGNSKCQGLIGLHNFTGSDWGGKFVGVSKERWSKLYMELPSDHPIVKAFSKLGSLSTEEYSFQNNELHSTYTTH